MWNFSRGLYTFRINVNKLKKRKSKNHGGNGVTRRNEEEKRKRFPYLLLFPSVSSYKKSTPKLPLTNFFVTIQAP